MQTYYYYKNRRITEADYNLLKRYVWANNLEEKDSLPCNTGNIEVMQLLLTIENDRRLSTRYDELLARIEKNKGKLTVSSSRTWDYVECKIIYDLLVDACREYNKCVDIEDKIKQAYLHHMWEVLAILGYTYENLFYSSSHIRLEIDKIRKINSDIYSYDYDKMVIPNIDKVREYIKENELDSYLDDYREVFVCLYIKHSEKSYRKMYENYVMPNFVCKLYYSTVFSDDATQLNLYLPNDDIRPLEFAVACMLNNKLMYDSILQYHQQTPSKLYVY